MDLSGRIERERGRLGGEGRGGERSGVMEDRTKNERE